MVQDILIVIDVQNGVCAGIYQREALITLINQRIAAYRVAQKPILFIQHHDLEIEKGSESWELVPELDARASDFYLDKTHANGFYHTDLQKLLTGLSVKKIEFCGGQTEFCVNSTLVFAHGLGYKNVMKRKASSTFDNKWMTAENTIDFYENHLWNHRFLEWID